jgi:high-affinity iron transporter
MLGALIIVFREVLEAALVIGVVAAAVQGLAHRGRRIASGVALGIAGSALVAAGLGVISQFQDGRGQELLQAAVLLIAGCMLIWHNLYMAEHGREVTAHLKTLGSEVMSGAAPVTMIVGVTAIAVVREGSEIVLFLYALAAGGAGKLGLLFGGLVGLACGVAVGYVLFLGLSRISVRRLFQVSGWIMLFIAAGMIGNAVMYLVQVDYLPALVSPLWDSSRLLSGSSIAGRTLSALAGYTPTPSLTQVAVWLATFVGVGG